MHVCGRRPVEVFAMAVVLRPASAFVAPVGAAARQTAAGCGVRSANVRCWMSAGAKAATPERVGLPVLDAQAAELKAERLWGMADAHKPRPSQTVTAEVSETQPAVESIVRAADKLPSVEGVGERDSFIEEEGEVSALRRYQYSDLLDDGESEDDEKEYYI
eukprot:jgi/Undpi1/6227/HiC_scaffold_20.g08711.m1